MGFRLGRRRCRHAMGAECSCHGRRIQRRLAICGIVEDVRSPGTLKVCAEPSDKRHAVFGSETLPVSMTTCLDTDAAYYTRIVQPYPSVLEELGRCGPSTRIFLKAFVQKINELRR